jgi:hypothetical protein
MLNMDQKWDHLSLRSEEEPIKPDVVIFIILVLMKKIKHRHDNIIIIQPS